MRPKKGTTARAIVKKLEEDLKYYDELAEEHWRENNKHGYEACEVKKLYISVLLSKIAE